jgi:hypothetical protein
MNINVSTVNVISILSLGIFLLGLLLILAGSNIFNFKGKSAQPGRKTLFLGIALLLVGLIIFLLQTVMPWGQNMISAPQTPFTKTPESSQANIEEPTSDYQEPLCGQQAYTAYPHKDGTADVVYDFPAGYTIGYISAEPALVEFSNDQAHLFRTPFVMILKGLSSVSLRNITTRQENGKTVVNISGCIFSPQDSDQAEKKAQEDYVAKSQGGNLAEIYLVTPVKLTLLDSSLLCLSTPYSTLGNDWSSAPNYSSITNSEVVIFTHCPPTTTITYESITIDNELQKVELVCADGINDITHLFRSFTAVNEELPHWRSSQIEVRQNCRIDFTIKNSDGGEIGLQIEQSTP